MAGADYSLLPPMLAELPESAATGDLAGIYAEIRDFCAVPYVSSMQRHLATRPGWLEWSWAAVRPVFETGAAQAAAWEAAAEVGVAPLPRLSAPALRLMSVVDHDAATIRAVAEMFVRASPTNLMFSGLLRRLLAPNYPLAVVPPAPRQPWRPPPALPDMPPLADPATLQPDARAVLMQFATDVAGRPFVPGLYRMLAHWPVYMAHLATVLVPRFDDAATKASCASVLTAIDARVPDIFASLPPLPAAPPMPPATEHASVLAALDRYRTTSPEMIVFGTLIRDALPAQTTRNT